MQDRYQSDCVDTEPLWTSIQFHFAKKVASGRLMKAAMSERLASWTADDSQAQTRGIPRTEMIRLYETWGRGNLGMLLTGNIMIDYSHLEAAGNPIIARDCHARSERFQRFQAIARVAKLHGSLIIGQLNHAGRQTPATIKPVPISASDVQCQTRNTVCGKPRPATSAEIDSVVEDFIHAARYLQKAGYDGVQLHAAHGYLLAQFLSTHTNRRYDEYGGCVENRMRIISRIAQGIRRCCGADFILAIKINSVDFDDGGFSKEEAKYLCSMLENLRFDFVELSGGSYANGWFNGDMNSLARREAYFLEFAKLLVPCFDRTKVYVTGGFRTAGAMVRALKYVDGIGLARPLCLEPQLARAILNSCVQGAVKQRIEETAFALSASVAGAQMWQLSAGRSPIDLSTEENEWLFKQELKRWAATDRFGYVRL